MHISKAVFATTISVMSMAVCSAQTNVNTPPTTGTARANTTFIPVKPSEILQRSLDELQQTSSAMKLDKWKRGGIRDEAGTNLDAIQRDLAGTLPGLLKEADAAPGSVSKVLPLSRNVDALYDVLLHVVEASRVIAPGDQVAMLQQTMKDLERARIVLDNQIQQSAETQEKQVVELRTTVQTQAASLRAAATPPPVPKCPAPTPAKKKHTTKSSTTGKPAAGTPATQSKPQ